MYIPLVTTHFGDVSGVAGLRAASDDADLVRRVLEGSHGAQEALFRQHAPDVLRLVTRLLRSHDEAEDVLHDTFVTAFRDLGTLRDPSALHAWLKQIAVHQLHRRFRKLKLLRLLGLDRSVEDAPLANLARTDAGGEARAELRLLDDALGTIPASERIAWVLRHVEGLSLEEVAQTCGCSLATAKRRIAAGDHAVRRHFEPAERRSP